jgi:6-phospho-beta-glucosidase
MKVAIIGGAGVRVPLLVRGLVDAALGIREIALFDIDGPRQQVIADLSRRAAGVAPAGAIISVHDRPEPCVDGARFVITSIRVGGSGRRARDEATAMAHGVVAQETVGAVGFAMAVRTIPAMVEYGRIVARLAPSAWMVTFTNPVSVVTQAVVRGTDARAIGICDTPYELFEDTAHALGLPPKACTYDYFGLNHLGWLREVIYEGAPQMHRLWDDEARLRSVYRDQLFDVGWLRTLRLLPTEYLYYYYRPDVALRHQRRAGTTRGVQVAALTASLFDDLARGVADPLARYEEYLARRDQSYMQIETGSTAPRVKPVWAELSGYDRIALMTMRAIASGTGEVIPLDVPNAGNFPFLAPDDVVEVPCAVDGDGPRALPVAPVPEQCAALMTTVKAYERATIDAALSGSAHDRRRALGMHPLAGSAEGAAALADALETP